MKKEIVCGQELNVCCSGGYYISVVHSTGCFSCSIKTAICMLIFLLLFFCAWECGVLNGVLFGHTSIM